MRELASPAEDQAEQEQQHDCPDEGRQERAQETASQAETDQSQQPAAQEGAITPTIRSPIKP